MSALVLTNRAITELADGDNRQLRNIQLRTLAVGTGTGAPSAALTALRAERQTGALVGTTQQQGRIAVVGSIAANADYNVAEVGIFARLGDTGAEWLFAYWSTENAATPLLRTTNGSLAIIPAVFDVDVDPAAEIAVTISPLIDFGARYLTNLADVAPALVASRWLKVNAAGDEVRFVTLPIAVAKGDDSDNLVSTEWLRDFIGSVIDGFIGNSKWRTGGVDLVDLLLARGGALSAKQTATATATAILAEYSAATATEVAKALQAAGYPATSVTPALKAKFVGITNAQVAAALAAARFSAAHDAMDRLAAGYTLVQTATALVAAYPGITASQMATALVAAYPGITASQMAGALLGAFAGTASNAKYVSPDTDVDLDVARVADDGEWAAVEYGATSAGGSFFALKKGEQITTGSGFSLDYIVAFDSVGKPDDLWVNVSMLPTTTIHGHTVPGARADDIYVTKYLFFVAPASWTG